MAGRMTKSQIVAAISDKTELAKKDVKAVFEELASITKRELGKRGPGEFVIPDLIKLKLRKVPARPAREGVNPFTGEKQMFSAKPASKKVRATALKKLKDAIQ